MISTYSFLLDTYETEILKITGIWAAFRPEDLDFRPAPQSRTVAEQIEHQFKSEGTWMKNMFQVDTGELLPAEHTQQAFIEKYRSDARRRLEALRERPDTWWQEEVTFFDVRRSRAWVMTRRINHSTHHRGQLIIYLRLLGRRVPSVYGPTADTGDKVLYSFGQ